jgi:hypothetical protein
MTTRISQLGDISTVQGNVLVPLVSNITGNLTTVKGTVDTLKAFIVAATEANIVTANIGMKGYVDSVTTAWTANAAQQLNDLGNLYANASSQQSTLNSLLANAGSQSDLIIGINANVTAANIGMIGYVDNKVSTANIGIIGYIDLGNTIQSAQISAANIGIKGYVDNSTLTANLGMKGYVDSVSTLSSYGNANVASYLPTHTGNIAGGNLTIAGNIISRKANIIGENNTGINAIVAGIPDGGTFGQSIAAFHGNINDSMLVTAHNKNTGNLSSVAFVAVADDGDAEYNNISMGVASSTWTPGLFGVYPHDGELAVAGGNLVISAGVNIDRDLIFTASSNFETARFQVSSPTSANLKLGTNVGIKFSDGTVQTSAYSNVQTATFTNLSNYAYNANVSNYSNVNVSALITTNGLTNYSNVNVIAYLAGNITVGNIAGSVNGYSIGYRDVPQITVANLTLIASDAGKHYYGANTNPTTITIPTNANVAFGNGTAISIVNQGTGNITVASDTGVSLYLAGNSTAGSRVITSYGMATLLKVQVNTWFINGSGVV